MLLGVRPDRADELVVAGHRLRVYVPFGTHWYEYSVRRLQENPKMAGYVAGELLGRIRRLLPALGAADEQREAAVDDERLAADHLGVGRAEEGDGPRDVVGRRRGGPTGFAAPAASISSRFGKCSSAPVSTTPPETALTRIPRAASSTAR